MSALPSSADVTGYGAGGPFLTRSGHHHETRNRAQIRPLVGTELDWSNGLLPLWGQFQRLAVNLISAQENLLDVAAV